MFTKMWKLACFCALFAFCWRFDYNATVLKSKDTAQKNYILPEDAAKTMEMVEMLKNNRIN